MAPQPLLKDVWFQWQNEHKGSDGKTHDPLHKASRAGGTQLSGYDHKKIKVCQWITDINGGNFEAFCITYGLDKDKVRFATAYKLMEAEDPGVREARNKEVRIKFDNIKRLRKNWLREDESTRLETLRRDLRHYNHGLDGEGALKHSQNNPEIEASGTAAQRAYWRGWFADKYELGGLCAALQIRASDVYPHGLPAVYSR